MRTSAHSEPSDEELVERFQTSGDEQVFEILFQRHWGHVYRQCFAFLRDAAAAEDIASETFQRAWRQLPHFRAGCFASWLAVIARHCCINYARSAWSRLVAPAGDGIIIMCDGNQGRRDASDFELVFELRRLVEQLSDEQRIPIKLYYIEGYSYVQIAEIMQCDVKLVRSRLQNGKRNLRLLWEQTKSPLEGGCGK